MPESLRGDTEEIPWVDGAANLLGNAADHIFNIANLCSALYSNFPSRSQVCMKGCPWRRDLFAAIGLGKTDIDHIIVEQMQIFCVNLHTSLDIINEMYTRYNLHSDAKV